MSNNFDPDQARRFVVPDLDQHCLQILSADDTKSQIVYTLDTLESADETQESARSHHGLQYLLANVIGAVVKEDIMSINIGH